MEEVKEVVHIASDFLKTLIDHAKNVRLEEVEEKPERAEWTVVLSFADEDSATLAETLTGKIAAQRIFKEIVVDTKQKKATALRMWRY